MIDNIKISIITYYMMLLDVLSFIIACLHSYVYHEQADCNNIKIDMIYTTRVTVQVQNFICDEMYALTSFLITSCKLEIFQHKEMHVRVLIR